MSSAFVALFGLISASSALLILARNNKNAKSTIASIKQTYDEHRDEYAGPAYEEADRKWRDFEISKIRSWQGRSPFYRAIVPPPCLDYTDLLFSEPDRTK